MKSSDLERMISTIVREQLRLQLPALLERVLSERYIRRVMTEHIETSDEEEIPTPPENDDEGIYRKDAIPMRDGPNEAIRRLIGKNSSMLSLFEGTNPIPSADSVPITSDVDLNKVRRLGVDLSRMKELAGMSPTSATPQGVSRVQKTFDPILDRKVDTRSGGDRQTSRSSILTEANGVFPVGPVMFDD